MARLQYKMRGDPDRLDVDDMGHPQDKLTKILDKMRWHGFKVQETDSVFRVKNPLTKNIEVEYRIT